MVLQNQPKGIDCFLAQFHVKQKKKTKQKWVNEKQRVNFSFWHFLTAAEVWHFTTKQSFQRRKQLPFSARHVSKVAPTCSVNSTSRYSFGHLPACILRPRGC